MEYPKVSVITITYGHEKYITESLQGVLMQQYDGPIEFIIANDNSPDGTDKVVKNFFKENPPPANIEIKYTKHVNNKGMNPNFIWAAQQATGKYITLCEGDDYWIDPLKLQKQVDFLEENTNCIFAFTGAKILLNNNTFTSYYKHKDFKNGIIKKKIFLKNIGGDYCTASAIFNKSMIEIFPSFFRECTVGDFPLGLLAISKGDIGYLEDETCVYRFNSVGSWSLAQKNTNVEAQYDVIFQTIDNFNAFTSNRFIKITNFYLNEFKNKIIYRRILENSISNSLVIILKNLSIDYKRNNQMFKTFMWKILKKKK